jgi:hypothetical protein
VIAYGLTVAPLAPRKRRRLSALHLACSACNAPTAADQVDEIDEAGAPATCQCGGALTCDACGGNDPECWQCNPFRGEAVRS